MFKKLNPEILRNTNTLWLTPNNRLSRYLLADLEVFSQNEPNCFLKTPQCLPLRSWLKALFDQLQTSAMAAPTTCLSRTQQVWVWRSILDAYFQQQPLIDSEQMITTAIKAWETLNHWHVPMLQVEQHQLNPDQIAFTDWAKQIDRLYQKKAYIDESQIATHLCQILETIAPEQRALLIPTQIVCYAFDEIAPAEQALLDACVHYGAEVHHFDLTLQQQASNQYRAATAMDEMRAAAHWAKQQVEITPHARIACIDPNLSSNRGHWQRVIAEVFTPDDCALLMNSDNQGMVVNISGGEVLSKTPVIDAALLWLQFCVDSIPTTVFSSLWRTPFSRDGAAHAGTYALLDKQLRQSGTTKITCRRLITLLKQWHSPQCDTESLLTHFTALGDTLNIVKQRKSFSQWMQVFDNALNQLGWPGDTEFNSEQYQKCQQWQAALGDVCQLDGIQAGEQTAQSALQQLRIACQARLYQPETVDTPVQVLGLLEAAGIAFDAVWITSLDNQNFPQAANPNPLLPYSLQAELNMPNATPAREHQFAKRCLQRYQASCRGPCVMSMSERIGGQEQLASSFIADVPALDSTTLPNMPTVTESLFQQRRAEILSDTHGIALTATQQLKGGSAVLSHYSACFFKGYAYTHLQAGSIQKFSDGFDALQRGLYCHSAMEWFWQQTKTSTALHAMDADAQMQRLTKAIDFAVARHLPKNLPVEHQHLIDVEKVCLQSILSQWLNEELTRSPFTVEQIEKSDLISLGRCQFKVRIDRIDKLADDSYVIIDYKTGLSNINDWFSGEARLDTPQLPLYAVTSPLEISGVMFAQLRADSQAYIGVCANTLSLDNVIDLSEDESKPDWPSLVAKWRDSMTTMGEIIASGAATINPKYAKQSCEFCDCAAFCRIKETIGSEYEITS